MTESLAGALAAFQAELPRLGKGNTARVEGKEGKAGYQYKYADLADVSSVVLPLLGKHGLSFSSIPTIDDAGRFVLEYTLRWAGEGTLSDSITGRYPLPSGQPQQVGSAISYARRYALCAITGVAPDEDDDGKAAAETTVDASARDYAWDPVEQDVLFTAWSDEIAKAGTADEITAIGKQILAGKQKGEISPNTYRKLASVGSARKAELNGAAKTLEAAK